MVLLDVGGIMFAITGHSGYHMTFANGWTASVQWGPGNYSDHYDSVYRWDAPKRASTTWESTTAEVAAWSRNGTLVRLEGGNTVRGYLTADEVLAFLNDIARRESE
jgi:hypothetical protein